MQFIKWVPQPYLKKKILGTLIDSVNFPTESFMYPNSVGQRSFPTILPG